MSDEQRELLLKARDSLRAAEVLQAQGFPGFAAARAYYAMFYVAEALLEGEGLAFSKHSAVIDAFGQRFVKTGRVPTEFYRYLIQGMERRHAGDYGSRGQVRPEQAAEQIAHAREFLEVAERLIEPPQAAGDK